jgi:hypothetical protein
LIEGAEGLRSCDPAVPSAASQSAASPGEENHGKKRRSICKKTHPQGEKTGESLSSPDPRNQVSSIACQNFTGDRYYHPGLQIGMCLLETDTPVR